MWHTLGFDFYGPLAQISLSKRFIFIAIDYFSKWVVMEALAIPSGKEVTRCNNNKLVCEYVCPKVIHSHSWKSIYVKIDKTFSRIVWNQGERL